MITLTELERYCNQLLAVDAFEDYCPNGLQVDAGIDQVRRLVAGVTASQVLIDDAVAFGADLLLVHHGYFWKGEAPALTGFKGRRIRTLMENGISLLAYHLPLDAHPELGNNRQLANRLDLVGASPLESSDSLIWSAELQAPLSFHELSDRIETALGRRPLHLAGGPGEIRRVGWCTGAAQGYIEQAAAAGLDAFVSGEVSEQTLHLARELGHRRLQRRIHALQSDQARPGGARSKCFTVEHWCCSFDPIYRQKLSHDFAIVSKTAATDAVDAQMRCGTQDAG